MRVIKHDIRRVNQGIIAHGCNCQGVMGSGAAKALRDKWPQIFDAYHAMCVAEKNKASLLGKMVLVEVGQNLYVANLLTQENFGADGRVYASRKAIETSLTKAFEVAAEKELPLYAVKIGALRGGLDWETDVKPIYEAVEKHFPTVKFLVCDL